MFAAFANPQAKARWFVGPDEWDKSDHKLDFRVGGRESVSGGPPGGPSHVFNAVYQDIVPNERIVYTSDMQLGTTRISVSGLMRGMSLRFRRISSSALAAANANCCVLRASGA